MSNNSTRPFDPAFPNPQRGVPGLTAREYFAGLAMQGHLAGLDFDSACKFNAMCAKHGFSSEEGIAKASVSYADALLAELAK